MSKEIRRLKTVYIRKSDVVQIIAYPKQVTHKPGGLFKNPSIETLPAKIFIFCKSSIDKPYRFTYQDEDKFNKELKELVESVKDNNDDFLCFETYDIN